MTLIKSISGIRGTVGGAQAGNLTPPDVVKFTTAYARLAARRKAGKKLTIVVGRDARISGEMVADLVEGTLLACGADVINVGLCTTPGVEMAVITHKADGGIIITASHNPRQWNALKLLNADGEFLSDAEGKQVLAMAEEEDYEYPTVDGIGRVLSREPFNERHIAQVLALPLVDAQAIRARRYKVVVDAVNSVGGIVMPELLRRLGCEVVELNCDPTGEFAHNPEPLPQNLTDEGGGVKMTVQIAQTVLLRFFGKREALHPCGCNSVAECLFAFYGHDEPSGLELCNSIIAEKKCGMQ